MAQNDIGIDLGTTTIIIAQAGQGVVLNQPSVVAMDTRKNSVLEVGDKALAMVGRTPNYISAIFPLKDGVISDHTMTRELICRFVNQVYSSHMVKPRVAVCVPAAITGIESDAVVEAVMAAGARQVYLIDEPIAAALGSGIDITQPDGRMIIDIGGGTTDIAVLSLGGKVKATSVRVAGNHYDDEILKHVRNKFSIAIGQRTAEQLKKNVACCPQKAGLIITDCYCYRNILIHSQHFHIFTNFRQSYSVHSNFIQPVRFKTLFLHIKKSKTGSIADVYEWMGSLCQTHSKIIHDCTECIRLYRNQMMFFII